MSLGLEIERLRQHLEQLASTPETDLMRCYALQPPPDQRASLYRRFRRSLGLTLRRLGLRSTPPLEPWLPGLNFVAHGEDARTLLIWALDTDRETLREACRGFRKLQATLPGWAPVLVTDVADFAFFSRLGWLVEYVPAFSAPAGGYAERKRHYLAWRYRGARAVPVSAGLQEGAGAEDLHLD